MVWAKGFRLANKNLHMDYHDIRLILRTLSRTQIQILRAIAEKGGRARLKDIQEITKAPKSTLVSRLAALTNTGLVRYESGLAELIYKTPFCYLANAKGVPYAYVGLLGKPSPDESREPETQTAIELLKQEGITIERAHVATTEDAMEEWMPIMNAALRAKLDFTLLTVKEMNNIESVMEKMAPKITELNKNFITILDCTSGLRPAGIAYYALAEKLKTPLIYAYLDEKRIYWLKTRQHLLHELGMGEVAKATSQ